MDHLDGTARICFEEAKSIDREFTGQIGRAWFYMVPVREMSSGDVKRIINQITIVGFVDGKLHRVVLMFDVTLTPEALLAWCATLGEYHRQRCISLTDWAWAMKRLASCVDDGSPPPGSADPFTPWQQ